MINFVKFKLSVIMGESDGVIGEMMIFFIIDGIDMLVS